MRNDDDDLRDIHFEVYGAGKVPYEFRSWMPALLPIYRKNRGKALPREYLKDVRRLISKAYLDELDEHTRTNNRDLFHAYHEAYEGRVDAIDNFVGLHELAQAAAKEAMEDVHNVDVSKDVSR